MPLFHTKVQTVLPNQITAGINEVLRNSTITDFRKFLTNDKVLGFAIGVVVGNTFTDTVKQFVALMRGIIKFISTFLFTAQHTVRWQLIPFGDFVSSVVSMLLIAGAVFVLVKILNSIWAQDETEQFGYNATLVESKMLRAEQAKTNELLAKLVALQTNADNQPAPKEEV